MVLITDLEVDCRKHVLINERHSGHPVILFVRHEPTRNEKLLELTGLVRSRAVRPRQDYAALYRQVAGG